MLMDDDAKERVADLRKGLHVAMDALIQDKDYQKAEVVLRQLDDALGALIRQTDNRSHLPLMGKS